MTVECPGAFDAAGFRFETDEQEFTAAVVDDLPIDEDAWVNGRYGGRRCRPTLEGEYDGPHGAGTYVFHLDVEEGALESVPKLTLWLAEGFHDDGQGGKRLPLERAEALSESDL